MPVPPPVTFDPRQQKIHEQLARLGPAPAAYFRDVCRLFQDLALLESSGHVAGHLLRELKGSIKDVLYPREVKEKSDLDAIQTIAEAYGLPADHEVIELWPNLELHKLAHRGVLGSPRQLVEVQKAWEEMQIVLSVLLDALDSAYTVVYARLDRLLAKAVPGTEDLTELREKIPNNGHTLSYFFGKVQGRRWFEVLVGSTMFDDPPQDYWPQAEYLRRVVADYPDAVARIFEKVAATWSYYTHHQILEAIPSLATAAAGRILKVSATALMTATGHDTFLAQDIATRAAAIGKEEPQAALDVFATLLALQPEAGEPQGGYLGARQLRTPLEYHTYTDVIGEPLRAMMKVAPRETFERLLDLLDSAVTAVYAKSKPDDFSKGWMPAIEPHAQNAYHYEALPRLAEALRDAAATFVKTEPAALPAVIEKLDTCGWQVLQRLAVHLLHEFGDPTDPLLHARVLDENVFFERDLRHEYGALLKKIYPSLPNANKATILGWIKGGPKVMLKEYNAEDERYLRESWALQRLSWLRGHLTAADTAALAQLEKEHGTPDESSEFSGYMSGPFWGPTSPKSEDELRGMSIPDLVRYLREWQPSGERAFGGFAPTREGLARHLQPIVKARAAEFAAAAESFIGVDATFVRAVIAGLDDAVKEKSVIEWEPLLRLCAWAVEQPRTIAGRDRSGFDDDPDWSWTWAAIARLLRSAFVAEEKAQVPLALRDAVWTVLEPITDDPDPDASRESEERDPFSTAINSTRGVAMEALVGYALWVRRRYYVPDGVTGFNDIPEVEEVLNRHLDPSVDPSRAIRAVYGESLYRLYRMNRSWFEAHLPALFPTNQPELADAVLHAYLAWGQYATPDLNALLMPQFARAIATLPAGGDGDEEKIPAYVGHVAQRLMVMYLHGGVDLAPESLLTALFARADESTRARAIFLVPDILKHAEIADKDAVRERAVTFWTWRLGTSSASDLRGFGAWMLSDEFDPAWRLAQLTTVLERTGSVDMDYQIVGALGRLCADFPAETLRCVRLLVGLSMDGMRLHGLTYRGDLQRIIRSALLSGDKDLRKDATAFANELVARGFRQFRDILDPNYQSPDSDDD